MEKENYDEMAISLEGKRVDGKELRREIARR
jgi:hypothetical protein